MTRAEFTYEYMLENCLSEFSASQVSDDDNYLSHHKAMTQELARLERLECDGSKEQTLEQMAAYNEFGRIAFEKYFKYAEQQTETLWKDYQSQIETDNADIHDVFHDITMAQSGRF